MGAAPSVPGEESSLWSSTQSDIVWLAEEGDYASVDALLHQGADVRAQRGGDGESALIVAARNGDARLLKLLLSHSSASRSAVALRNRRNESVLSVAAAGKRTSVLKMLLRRCEWDLGDLGGALLSAARAGRMRHIEVMVLHGASPMFTGGRQRTAAHVAASGGGGDGSGSGSSGAALLSDDAGAACLELLLDMSDDLADACDIHGGTALHVAASSGRPRCVATLLAAAFCPHRRTRKGATPGDLAREHPDSAAHRECVQLLDEYQRTMRPAPVRIVSTVTIEDLDDPGSGVATPAAAPKEMSMDRVMAIWGAFFSNSMSTDFEEFATTTSSTTRNYGAMEWAEEEEEAVVVVEEEEEEEGGGSDDGVVVEEWVVRYDPDSGEEYYLNTRTAQSSWEWPPLAMVVAAAEEEERQVADAAAAVADESWYASASARDSYHHPSTSSVEYYSEWGGGQEEAGYTTTERGWASDAAVGYATTAETEYEYYGADADNGWETRWDDAMGAEYYINLTTGESSWMWPPESEAAARAVDDEAAMASTSARSMEGGGGTVGNTGWEDATELWDETSEQVYIQNTLTNETMWKWAESVDAESGARYWSHAVTGDVVWESESGEWGGGGGGVAQRRAAWM